MPSRRHVFVVGCGFPQLGLLRSARELGFEITGADMNPNAIGVGLADHFVLASTGDADAIAAAFQKSHAGGITTSGSELSLTTTAIVAGKLKLPFYADRDTVHRCQAKDAMRAGYRAAGLHVPAFAHCSEIAEARSFAAKLGYPLVVKPANGWGQRGVRRVEDESQLVPAFELACSVSHGHTGAVIEEHLRGHELSVNGWVEAGTLVAYCVTDREVFPGSAPLGVMRSEIAPSVLDVDLVSRAMAAARDGARALGLLRGPCYSQVAVTSDRAVLFETAARLGGGFDADVTRLHSGVDLYARLLGVAFQDPDLERSGHADRAQPALVRFLAPTPGRLVSIEGLGQARAMPGIVDAVVYPKPGDSIPALTDAAKRIGHILAVGRTRSEAISRADAAESAIRLHLSAPYHPDRTSP